MLSIQEHSKNMKKCIDYIQRKTDWSIDIVNDDDFLFSFPYISSLQLAVKWDLIQDTMYSTRLKHNNNVIYVSYVTKQTKQLLIDVNNIIMNMIQTHQLRLQKRK